MVVVVVAFPSVRLTQRPSWLGIGLGGFRPCCSHFVLTTFELLPLLQPCATGAKSPIAAPMLPLDNSLIG